MSGMQKIKTYLKMALGNIEPADKWLSLTLWPVSSLRTVYVTLVLRTCIEESTGVPLFLLAKSHSILNNMNFLLSRLPRLWKRMKASKHVFAVIHLQNMIAIYNGQPANEKAVDLIIVQGVCVIIIPPKTVQMPSP